jgi:hypothetical protein
MKSIKNQYIDLQEGKMTKANFMRNLRMTLPQFVTNVTSFEDSVRILKNKGILSEVKELKGSSGKEQYAKFEKEVPANYQEILTGIKIEHEATPEKSYEDIVKVVVKKLKKQPNYYTNWKLSGVEGKEPEILGAVKPEDSQMKFVKDGNVVDKAMGMKPVKGIEKPKKDADAKKETIKAVGKIELMTLIAQTVRGIKKMEGAGEKMKVVKKKLKESIEDEDQKMRFKDLPADPETYKTVRDMKGKIIKATNAEGNEFQRGDVTTAFDGEKIKIEKFEESQGKIKAIYNTGMFYRGIDIDGLNPVKPTMRPGVNIGASFEKFKRSLREMIRNVMSEMYDGRDNVTDVTGEND